MPSWRGPETYWGTEWESLEKANVIQKSIVKKNLNLHLFNHANKTNNYICFVAL